jgi:putative ABC transport system permease protein
MSGLVSDLRSAWRQLRRGRGTSLLILLTLALGLGANAAIFAIGRGVLLRPLPYSDPDRLVLLWARRTPSPPASTGRGLATPYWFQEIVARQRTFSSIAAIESWNGNPGSTFDLAASGGGERLRGAFATPNFFATIGVSAALGRAFADADPPDLAVISHELWQRLFAGSQDVIGRRIDLAAGRGKQRAVQPLTIIGVLPPRVQFSYPESTDVWLPLTPERLKEPRAQNAIMYRIVARLRPETTLAQAHDDMAAAKSAMALERGREYMNSLTFWLEPVHENAVGTARPALRLLSAVAALVFLVACLNVAALLLAQTVERRREIAVQLALGASGWRVVRQLVTESGLMAVVAAAIGVAVVMMLQPMLRAAMPPGIPRIQEIGVDLLALAWVSALVALAVILSTIVPAWRSSAIDPGTEIGQSARTATQSRGAARWRQGLVAAQVAVVVVLLVGGGLLLRSFWKLQHVDPGFDGTRVFTAEMRLLNPRYFDGATLRAFQSELLWRVRALPGVERASITSAVPLRGVDWTRAFSHAGTRLAAKERDIDADYFAVMKIPLLAGRTFSNLDAEAAAPVVIVSQSLARHLFPSQNPVGQRLELDPKNPAEIVGVVGDVRNVRVEADGDLAYYVPRAQQSSELICLVARTAPGTADLAPAVRAIVASLDPMQPVLNATTIDGIVSDSIADRRFYATTTGAFALLTLLLAAAGLYGVTSHSVAARTREIGIRVALGAAPMRLLRMLIGQGVGPVLVGLACGLVASLWAGRLLQRFLFDLGAFDLLTYAGTVTWVLALTVLACWLPSWRAARLSPTVALRHE